MTPPATDEELAEVKVWARADLVASKYWKELLARVLARLDAAEAALRDADKTPKNLRISLAAILPELDNIRNLILIALRNGE